MTILDGKSSYNELITKINPPETKRENKEKNNASVLDKRANITFEAEQILNQLLGKKFASSYCWIYAKGGYTLCNINVEIVKKGNKYLIKKTNGYNKLSNLNDLEIDGEISYQINNYNNKLSFTLEFNGLITFTDDICHTSPFNFRGSKLVLETARDPNSLFEIGPSIDYDCPPGGDFRVDLSNNPIVLGFKPM